MRQFKLYLAILLLIAVGVVSCDTEFDRPPVILPEGGIGNGTAQNPITTLQVLNNATGNGMWVTGYIVGWIDTNSGSYALNETTAKFSAPATLRSNLLMAANADESNYENCIAVQLPSGDVRSALNLQDNPGNIGKQVTVYGNITTYFGVNGVKELSNYNWGGTGIENEDVEISTDPVTELYEVFNGSIPATWKNVGSKAFYATEFDGQSYAAMTGYKGTPPFDQWLISPAVNIDGASDKTLNFDSQVNGYGSTTTTFKAYVLTSDDPSTATKTELTANWASAPASGYSGWVNSGDIDLSSYSGVIYIGFNYVASEDANYATWCVTNVRINHAGGGDTPEVPDTPSTGGPATYKKVTSITSGKEYLMYADGNVATPLAETYSYGYLKAAAATDDNGVITMSDNVNGFIFTETNGGYTIVDAYGRYLYQTGTFKSFNVSTTFSDECVWSVEAQNDGTFKITNISVGKFIQYDLTYKNYGSYDTLSGTLPCLYEKVD